MDFCKTVCRITFPLLALHQNAKYEETFHLQHELHMFTRVVYHSWENLTEYLTTIGHLKQIVLSKFLEHAPFNLHKLLKRKEQKSTYIKKTKHINTMINMWLYVCIFTDVAGHHDGEQRLVVRVEGDVEGGRLDHDENGMQDWTATQENHRKPRLNTTTLRVNLKPHISWTNQTRTQKPSCGFWY